MKINFIYNSVNNHASFYRNFSLEQNAEYCLIDEPYGLRLLLYTYILSRYKKYYLVVHNCNTWFQHKKFSAGSGVLFNLKAFLRRSIVSRANTIIVVSEFQKTYLSQLGINQVISLPFINQSDYEVSFIEPATCLLVVPGTVSRLKRYDRIVHFIKQHKEISQVSFLGSVDLEFREDFMDIVEIIESETGCKVEYSFNHVSDDKFSLVMRMSSYCFVDYHEKVITKEGYYESFGISKDSGTFWLAAKYGLKLVAPILRRDIPGLEIELHG